MWYNAIVGSGRVSRSAIASNTEKINDMVKGRPKSNPALLEAEGYYRKNPDRRPDPSKQIKATSGRPLPTLLVSSDELTLSIWDETCNTMDSLGILAVADRHVIEAYCLNVRELYFLTDAIRKNGHGQLSNDGTKKTCPDVVSWHKCMGTHLKLMGELALTPQARLRMCAPEAKNEGSDMVSDLMKKLGG